MSRSGAGFPLADGARETGAALSADKLGGSGHDDRIAQHYAAIMDFSDDAILSKDLGGTILTWNAGAERLFGFTAAEAIGRPATIIVSPDRLEEEQRILDRIRRGERIRNFETVRRRKDGSPIDVSLAVAPMRDSRGRVVGVSEIGRDGSELKRARERRQLLLQEMNHRLRNLLALAGAIVGLSVRSAKTPRELANSARERLTALARAQALTFPHDEPSPQATTLHALIRAIVAPFDDPKSPRIVISGADVPVSGGAVADLALLMHEFAANAAKYGALSSAAGTIAIACEEDGDQVIVDWVERGGPPVSEPKDGEGFGAVVARIAAGGRLGGDIARLWKAQGLEIRLITARDRLAG